MRRTVLTVLGVVFVLALASIGSAQTQTQAGPPSQAARDAGPMFVDADGDGICDLQQSRVGQKRGRGHGPGDGTGNRGVGPRDGSGYGPGARAGTRPGDGICDGSGKGRRAMAGQAGSRRR